MGTIQRWFSDCLTQVRNRLGFGSSSQAGDALPTGQQVEQFVAKYLQQQGLRWLQSNYTTKAGEIDLIMRDEQALVFVEVKYRQQSNWAQAAETVTQAKQRRIIMAAKQYMQHKKVYDRVSCRFDVVAVDDSSQQLKVNWIKHAFY